MKKPFLLFIFFLITFFSFSQPTIHITYPDVTRPCAKDTVKVRVKFPQTVTEIIGVAFYFQLPIQIDTASRTPSDSILVTQDTINGHNYIVFYPTYLADTFCFSFLLETCSLAEGCFSPTGSGNRHFFTKSVCEDSISVFLDTISNSSIASASLFYNNRSTSNDTILFYAGFPLFEYVIDGHMVDYANQGEQIIRTIVFQNNGSTDSGFFQGYFNFKDSVQCSNIRIDSIQVSAGWDKDKDTTFNSSSYPGNNLINETISLWLTSSDTVYSYDLLTLLQA